MSTSKRRSTYHHRDLRAALLREATARVDAGGAEGFSLRETARSIGVSPGAAYRHFTDKAELLAAVIDTEFAELADELAAARDAVMRDDRHPPGVRAAAIVLASGQVYVRRAATYPERFRLTLADARMQPGPGEQRVRSLGDDMRAQLVETGAMHPRMFDSASWSIVPALHGLACLAADGLVDRAHLDAGVRVMVETVLRGLGVAEETLIQMDSLVPEA